MPPLNQTSGAIVDAALHIHKSLGPGLLESVYEATLAADLTARGLQVHRQHPIPLSYQGIHLPESFRADLIVDNQVIVEIKSVEAIAPVHKKQLLTYLRLTRLPLGLLINFNVPLLKAGLHRLRNFEISEPL